MNLHRDAKPPRLCEINPEAGDHAIPQDPRKIDLALRAAELAWNNFPYLEKRYGARGRCFTQSDSCWLVTLIEHPVDRAADNLRWLRKVLATRGIPSLILESHLRMIQSQFEMEFPESLKSGQGFTAFLRELEDERIADRAVGDLTRHAEVANTQLANLPGGVPSSPFLLLSAWIDENLAGVSRAFESIDLYLGDRSRFSDVWVEELRPFRELLQQYKRRR